MTSFGLSPISNRFGMLAFLCGIRAHGVPRKTCTSTRPEQQQRPLVQVCLLCCPFRVLLAQHYPSRDLPQLSYVTKRFKDLGATFHAHCGKTYLKCTGPQDPVLSSVSQAVTWLWKSASWRETRGIWGWERGIEP